MLLHEGTHMLALFLSWLHADPNARCVGNVVLASLPTCTSQICVSWENTEGWILSKWPTVFLSIVLR